VEERLVEVLRYANVIGVNGPGSHITPGASCGSLKEYPLRPASSRRISEFYWVTKGTFKA
jgi:hypothetical protein